MQMSALTGPLGSHNGYITHIALPNCSDYFELCEAQRENGTYEKTRSKYKRLRYFLNAAESLNNIPEYIFHEYKIKYNWKIETDVRALLSKRSKIHETINTLANGYKHCIRNASRDSSKAKEIDAADFQEITITAKANFKDPQSLNIKISFDSIEDEEILGEAFRFWIDYHGNYDLPSLLGVCV
jgi:hypothetical protein